MMSWCKKDPIGFFRELEKVQEKTQPSSGALGEQVHPAEAERGGRTEEDSPSAWPRGTFSASARAAGKRLPVSKRGRASLCFPEVHSVTPSGLTFAARNQRGKCQSPDLCFYRTRFDKSESISLSQNSQFSKAVSPWKLSGRICLPVVYSFQRFISHRPCVPKNHCSVFHACNIDSYLSSHHWLSKKKKKILFSVSISPCLLLDSQLSIMWRTMNFYCLTL